MSAKWAKGSGGPAGDEAYNLVVGVAQNEAGEVREGASANTLGCNGNATGRNAPLMREGLSVRRLTPVECERLQGFPDGWTDVPWRRGRSPDTLRYRAVGNAMSVNVMEWLGERIALVDSL